LRIGLLGATRCQPGGSVHTSWRAGVAPGGGLAGGGIAMGFALAVTIGFDAPSSLREHAARAEQSATTTMAVRIMASLEAM